MLKDKVAMIYGAGGAVGSAVARAFAIEGANLFLTGRSLAPVELVAKDVVSAGGSAEAAEVDALDEQAVDEHLRSVIGRAGRVDISFNAIGIPSTNVLYVPLTELDVEHFSLPITTLVTPYFVTARLAARHMVPNGSGVIMTVTTLHSRQGFPLAGGYGPAQAAKEALTRELSAELAPHGIRVVGLRPHAMPESRAIQDGFETRSKSSEMTWEQFQGQLASRTHTQRLMTLAETANMAAFMASDKASGMTGTTVNLSMGSLDDSGGWRHASRRLPSSPRPTHRPEHGGTPAPRSQQRWVALKVVTDDARSGTRLSIGRLTRAAPAGRVVPRRRPAAELWNVRPSRGSIGEGELPSRSSMSQAISQHRVAGGRGCQGEACP